MVHAWARRGVCAMCVGTILHRSLAATGMCVLHVPLHLWAVVARDECWMHVARYIWLSPRCVGVQFCTFRWTLMLHNVTLTAILLQYLRYRARSRPPRRRASHSKSILNWLAPWDLALQESFPGGRASRNAEFRLHARV